MSGKRTHFKADHKDADGRCPECGEDEMDGARCLYCGYHDYNCEMADCEKCSTVMLNGGAA